MYVRNVCTCTCTMYIHVYTCMYMYVHVYAYQSIIMLTCRLNYYDITTLNYNLMFLPPLQLI